MANTPTGRFILVACAASKVESPAAAKDLYVSDLFTKSRAWAEREVREGRADGWFILSAKHGLLTPDEVIAPYDEKLTDKPRDEREAWGRGVVIALSALAPNGALLVFLAGEAYRKPIAPYIGVPIEVPMAGLGIGEQKAWLKGALDTPTTPVGQLAIWPTLF